MSRIITLLLLALLLPCCLLADNIDTANQKTVAVVYSPVMPGAYFDGVCTMAPLYIVSVWMGAGADYNIDTGDIALISADHKVNIKIGSDDATIDGDAKKLSSPVVLKEDNIIYAPAGAIAIALGGELVLPESPNSLTISNPKNKERLRLFLGGREKQAAALFAAVVANRALDVQIILNNDPELALARDFDNNTLLHIAAINNNISLPVSLTIKDCTTTLPEKLNNALTIAKLLLANGASPNAQNRINITPFTIAAGEGLTPFHLLLAENGADVNGSYANGNTQLIYAVKQRNLPVVKYLLAHGALPDIKNKDDFYALRNAIFIKDTDVRIVDALLDAGADPNIIDGNGWTSLDAAAWYGQEDVVVKLLAHKANPNSAMRREKLTPLHSAIIIGSAAPATLKGDGLTMARELIAKGADVNAKDINGDTPLHFAVRQGGAKAVDFLIANKADVNARNNNNESPLRLAVAWGQQAIADVLAKNGGKQ
ncbi:MAG: ankyrin repeat domain-containing protein [bacterium]